MWPNTGRDTALRYQPNWPQRRVAANFFYSVRHYGRLIFAIGIDGSGWTSAASSGRLNTVDISFPEFASSWWKVKWENLRARVENFIFAAKSQSGHMLRSSGSVKHPAGWNYRPTKLLPHFLALLTEAAALIAFLEPSDCHGDDNELRLIRHLLANYDASARPASNASHAMQVIFGMSLHLIIDVVSESLRPTSLNVALKSAAASRRSLRSINSCEAGHWRFSPV